ncbi:MAG: 2OG-Fe(II) oxygenase [Terricaulis sp.]
MSSDAETRFRDLQALIADPAAPLNPEYVVAEADACAAEVPGAARFAAVTWAAGYGRAQDWRAAFACLGAAAARGDASACAQIELLNPQSSEGWQQRAAGVDVGAWIAAKPVLPIMDRPRVGQVEDFLPAPICAWLIAQARARLMRSMVFDAATGGGRRDDTRTNSATEFSLADLEVLTLVVRARIAASIGMAAENLERTSVLHYSVGQRFAPHADYLEAAIPQFAANIARFGQRVTTFLVYLNDDFEGGETRFVAPDRKIRTPAGGALVFANVDENGAPDPLSKHEGMPPTHGEKWLLSQFVRNKPQAPG